MNRYTPRRFRESAHPNTKATRERREYLVLHYEAGHWDFPKGHLEEGETEEQAAVREIFEETGLHVDRFFPGYREETGFWFWSYPDKPGGKSHRTKKIVTFFLAEVTERDVRLSHEHTGYVWLPYADAMKLVTHDNARNLLKHAERHVRQRENPQPGRGRGNQQKRRHGPHRNNVQRQKKNTA